MKKISEFFYPVRIFFILFIYLVLSVTSIVTAQDSIHIPVLGPETFTRTTQKPITTARDFITPYPERVYTIKITNGEPKVTAAFIDLNGETLFGPDDFQKSTPVLEKTITLEEHNTLAIQLRSKPTSNITIEIYGSFYPPPPHKLIQ